MNRSNIKILFIAFWGILITTSVILAFLLGLYLRQTL